MKNQGKKFAFLAALLSLSILLTGCGAGSNTGVWIAIIVMVFIAVFAATSGVVYLVLQKVLPPEEEQPHAARPAQHRSEEIDDVGRRPLLRPTAQTAVQNRGGEWICPRDHSRNTGPYCIACGASRPQKQAAARPAQASRTVRSEEEARYAPQSRQSYAPTGTTQTRTQPAAPAGTTQTRTQPAAPQQEQVYTGKFARKEPQPVQEESIAGESEYDAELLAAIFREAEQGDSEE